MNLPEQFSLVDGNDGVIAPGPFVVEITLGEDHYVDLGFDMTKLDDTAVEWMSFTRLHFVVPAVPPVLQNNELLVTDADGDTFLFRPLALGDGVLVGSDDPSVPSNEEEAGQALEFLAESLYRSYTGETTDSPFDLTEENLYVTRDQDGEPLALIKMTSSFPTLIRQDNRWRALKDDEDELLGVDDSPVRQDAVIAWDSGNLQELGNLVLDDRFLPDEVLAVWLETDETDEIKRLLIERSRGRVYERTPDSKWIKATPNPDAPTVDVSWQAVGAWDDGDLRRLGQASRYDVDGEAA